MIRRRSPLHRSPPEGAERPAEHPPHPRHRLPDSSRVTPARDRSLRIVDSPAGALRAEATVAGVTALHPLAVALASAATGTLAERVGTGEAHLDSLERELAAYARGELREFRTPLDLEGAGVRTEFRREAYREMTRIPFGTTASYRQVAEDAGSPLGARAVGGFCRDTPMILLVPVHRVIRSDGTTVGCKGEDRAALLAHEREVLARERGADPRSGGPRV